MERSSFSGGTQHGYRHHRSRHHGSGSHRGGGSRSRDDGSRHRSRSQHHKSYRRHSPSRSLSNLRSRSQSRSRSRRRSPSVSSPSHSPSPELRPRPRSPVEDPVEAYSELLFHLVDHHRSPEELSGQPRPDCSVIAGPVKAVPSGEGQDVPLTMSGFNHDMIKYVNKRMGWPASTALIFHCELEPFPVLTVFDQASYSNFVTFCMARGAAAMRAKGVVNAKVFHYINPRSRKSGLSRPLHQDKPARPQVANYKALRAAMKAGAEDDEDLVDDEVETGARAGVGSFGKWTEKCNEIVAAAESGKVLRACLERRTLLGKVFKGSSVEALAGKLLLNPVQALCPFQYKDDEQLIECHAKRHALGASNFLHKMIDARQGHFSVYHRDAAARSVAARLRAVLERPRITDADLDAVAPLIDAPLRDGLFDDLPELFEPGFTMAPSDNMARWDWTNRATRLAATAAEVAEAAAAAADVAEAETSTGEADGAASEVEEVE